MGQSEDAPELVLVSIGTLKPGYSPRLMGVDTDHVRKLAELDNPLPPIAVHHPSMRIIDGMHRVHAALARGDSEIWVEYFEGDEATTFLVAVQKNIAHGLPLTSADRVAAVERIIQFHPAWSDRAIAAAAGLSGKTVAAIRQRSIEENSQPSVRVGRDGRLRPLDISAGRLRAGEIVTSNPQASLRAIAKDAGISVATARDVRERLKNRQDPVPSRRRTRPQQDDVSALRRDPSLRYSDLGRLLLRLLEARDMPAEKWDNLADAIPEHCVPAVAAVASELAQTWRDFARRIERRRRQAGNLEMRA